jgi:hypothetical protein
MHDGWTVLINDGHLYDHAPAAPDSPIQKLVAIVGIGANGDFVNKNQNTVLRFLSVVWRTIDAVKKDPSLFELQAPYLNSVAGTSLDAAGVEATIKRLDPLSPFEYGSTYFEDKNSVLYWLNAWPAIIKDYVAHGVIRRAVSADDFVWAAPIWQMKSYHDKTDDSWQSWQVRNSAAISAPWWRRPNSTTRGFSRRLSPAVAASADSASP